MKCLHPLYALDLGVINPETGKKAIKILPKRADQYSRLVLEEKYGAGSILSLPCGKCLNCRVNYARTWALRCVCEASLYDENWFLTLTYDDKNYPGCAKKDDLQKFIKRVRKVYPGVRYFACCERGEHTHRYHFHLILFNLHLTDIKCLGKGPKGGYYYESASIKKLWPYGFYVLGDVNYTTCNYVAQYCLKKVYDDKKSDEFVTMSLKPGIGSSYFQDHWKDIYDTDKIYIANGNQYVSTPPRYFDKLLDRVNPFIYCMIKDERISKASVTRLDELLRYGLQYEEEAYAYNEKIAVDRMKQKLKARK